MRTDGVEPPQHEAAAVQAAELTNAQRPQERGDRPDSNRRRGDHGPECFRLHHGHSGDGRDRTGGLSPDKRALYAAELRPLGGRERGRDSNPRSRAHEAREDNRSSTAQVWLAGVEPAVSGARSRWGGLLPYSQMRTLSISTPGGTRTRSFRVEGPASSPVRPRGHKAPAAGLEPAPHD